MVVRKSKRSRHQRGRTTGGWGFSKRHRGKGSRGGHGYSGAGKRGAHRESFYHARGIEPLGKKGIQFKPRTFKVPEKTITIEEIDRNASKWGTEVDLTKLGFTKVLGQGKLTHKLKVTCHQFSESAKKKIEEAGGQIVQPKE